MEFSVPGSIVRIKMIDFMQYTDVEFRPGPNLNVILGPNGSGKSTIVNAICLGMAGKTGFLGRATSIAAFIRGDRDEAEVEVELFNDDDRRKGKNIVINRRWDRNCKSRWTLNGKTVPQKEVERVVESFQIQVGNLCQFLPQDKVHDFSKMNSKELLNSTINAVGETQLKIKHEELKKLQSDLDQSADRHQLKMQTLASNRAKLLQMEADVQNFKEKEKIDEQISLLRKRKCWSYYQEQKAICQQLETDHEDLERKLKEEEKKVEPLKRKLKSLEASREEIKGVIKDLTSDIRQCTSICKEKSSKIERIEEDIERIDEQIQEVDQKAEERRLQIKKYEAEIAALVKEIKQEEDLPSLEGEIRKIQTSIDAMHGEESRMKQIFMDKKHEKQANESEIEAAQGELEKLKDIDSLKLKTLRETIPQGEDAYKAVMYFRDHEFNFKGKVYEPIFLHLDLKDPSYGVYLENTIGARDIVAFAAEVAEDATELMNVFRNKQRLKVNVVHVDPSVKLESFKSTTTNFNESFGFKGYVKDMFTAPEPIMCFLCQMYGLHTTAIFGPEADAHLEKLVEELKVFFVDKTRYGVTLSRYSRQKSTSSNHIQSKKWFKESMDSQRVVELEDRISALMRKSEKLLEEAKEYNTEYRNLQKKREAKLQELKTLISKQNYLKQIKSRLNSKRQNLQSFLSTKISDNNLKSKFSKQKFEKVKELITLNGELKNAIIMASEKRIRLELRKLQDYPFQNQVSDLTKEIREMENGLTGSKEEVQRKAALIDQEIKELRVRLQSVQEAFEGLNKPPKDLLDRWKALDLPQDCDEIETMIGELTIKSECLGNVDRKVIREYNRIKASIDELEEELSRRKEETEALVANLTKIKTEWLERLNNLVDRINGKFSSNFSVMGFAGQVQLHEGNFENDFANYGLDILVKYRANVEMSKLTPHMQSGGERSVATALYMMALQELTKVPFRCVDEINQGMDTENERKVFDLLVSTSCQENSAQYFLLTPKLLPNLNYNRRMKVLVINNGETMCHYRYWNVKRFIELYKNRKNSK